MGGRRAAARALSLSRKYGYSHRFMSIVTASIRIAAPAAEVWKTIMDPSRLGDWVTIHRSLRHADDGPVRVGFEMGQRVHLRGVSLDVHWRLAQCTAERHAVWEGKGPARSRARTEYKLTDLGDDNTHFDYANEFTVPLGPIGALASRALVGGMPEREATRTLERLRALLESA